jgi:Mg2+-importing ATPase
VPLTLEATTAASASSDAILRELESSLDGLTSQEAAARRAVAGPNAVRSHHARPLAVLARQLRSALFLLLATTAVVSFFLHERSDAIIIGVILTASVGLGFFNEFRAERAAEALHSQLRHRAVVRRDGRWTSCDVTELVPGDVVRLDLGSVVPADVRVLRASGLECDESVLTGESVPVEKQPEAVAAGAALAELSSCAFMGTIVSSGSAVAVVVATGSRTEFGHIALGLGERQEETAFQVGLRQFSGLLARVAGVLTGAVFVINVVLGRRPIDALLFSLAIAVGITPQLLPAVVTTSLATGSRRLARKRVLVKRLVCIEDLGDMEVLLTDKTGTLTEGHVTFEAALDTHGASSDAVWLLGLVCNEASVEGGLAVGGNPLDVALWEAPGAAALGPDRYRVVATLPFDHDRRRVTVLADGPDGRVLITKGAPEGVAECACTVDPELDAVLSGLFRDGSRVVSVATRPAPDVTAVTAADERDLKIVGVLVFRDEPKATAADAVRRLEALGVRVKVVTGDNAIVAEHVCDVIGLDGGGTLTGDDLDGLDDDALMARLPVTRVFARVSPEQKSRLIRLHRHSGVDVAFLGDGVNDAVAIHHADIGISVDSATDVARDAADIVLLEKDLDVLADGVVEGRRIFANTMKYVFMGTSSNFGNMFSAAAASTFMTFLPMLPSQILLNNLLYDTSQMAIPSDQVDEEQLRRPSHWDIRSIRRFMLCFGPISSIFDFLTFALLLGVFHAKAPMFRSGWFVESLATQCLVIFVIRTRRVPFLRSRPSRLLAVATITVVVIGALLPLSPFAHDLGFAHLPLSFFMLLIGMLVAYLALAEGGKVLFYRWVAKAPLEGVSPVGPEVPRVRRRLHRRAARFTHRGPLPIARPQRGRPPSGPGSSGGGGSP